MESRSEQDTVNIVVKMLRTLCTRNTMKSFFDATSKQWVVAHRSAEEESWSTLDAEDNQILSILQVYTCN